MSKKIRVLLVDDDIDQLFLVSALLEARGFDVVTAPGAQDGLVLLENHVVDVVVSDVMMPDMSGDELLHRVRATVAKIPFILFSAAASKESLSVEWNEFTKFLTKGLLGEQICSEINSLFLAMD